MGSSHEMATKNRLLELLAEGLCENQIAETLGVAARTVNRAMIRHGIREKNPDRRVTPEERARIFQLADEGMIVRWIAEDVGRSEHVVGEIIGPRLERNREWRSIWQSIRRSPALLELHAEFAPPAREAMAA